MARHVLLVHANPTEGAEGELNTWYDDVHLPDVLKVPGFVSARRFASAPSVHGELPEQRYLALYEIEADSLEDALAALSRAAKKMDLSPALDRSTYATYAFTQISEA